MFNGIISFSLPGFVLGGAFGVFTAGIDTNVGFDPKDPLKTPTAREVLRDMGQRGMSYAKNFAIVGAMFSCTECIIESVSFPIDSPFSCRDTKHMYIHNQLCCALDISHIFTYLLLHL